MTGPNSSTVHGLVFLGGLLALAVATVSSGMLVAQHFGGIALWGCGPESGCARAAASAWGKVPGVNWPVSIMGFSYFAAMACTWLIARRGVPSALRWIARFGALVSVMYLVVMIAGSPFCQYCLVAHLANLVFLVLLEMAGGRERPAMPALGAFGGALVVTAASLLVVNASAVRQNEDRAEDLLTESTEEMTGGDLEPAPGEPFTGRYRQGPEEAAIRIVIISDYQCPDCRNIESQVRTIMAERDDVSFSAKHFPMNGLCNRFIKGRGPHPNACWAARCAETAGILRGNEGFWEMHEWLFDRKGSFTDAELPVGLREMGYDVREFLAVMQSPETLEVVQADIEEAHDLGLHFTPMVFINGVELKGWIARNAVIRAVDRVAASNPPARSAAYDAPPLAAVKYIEDWREKTPLSIPAADLAWARGPEDAVAEILVFGDLQEKNTGKVHREVLARIERGASLRYRFMHYPVNQSCNPTLEVTRNELACLAAQAAEAAGELGGVEAYWRMHDWLIEQGDALSMTGIGQRASELGFDAAAFGAAMSDAATGAAIEADARAGKRLGLRFVPQIYVNRKWLPRWQLEGHDILGQVIEDAQKQE
jgi:protein-disulfide isomerase/uncharacterized membrane protein